MSEIFPSEISFFQLISLQIYHCQREISLYNKEQLHPIACLGSWPYLYLIEHSWSYIKYYINIPNIIENRDKHSSGCLSTLSPHGRLDTVISQDVSVYNISETIDHAYFEEA